MATQVETVTPQREVSDPLASSMRRDGRLSLRASGPLADLLDQLSSRLELPVADVLAGAVLLLKIAVDAQDADQRICLTDRDLNIVGEVVDLVEVRPLGMDHLPEANPGQLDS